MTAFTCSECGSNLLSGWHERTCSYRWPKTGRRFEHATETWQPMKGTSRDRGPEPMPCEITRVIHGDKVWYRTPAGKRVIAYDEFRSILGKWLS